MRKPNGYWTLKNCKKIAVKHKTRISFKKESETAYQICRKNKWLDIVCKHMLSRKESQSIARTKWTLEKCKKIALKCKTRTEFHKMSNSAYNSCKKNKWMDIVCKHMLSRKETREINLRKIYKKCKKEALKYKTRSEFCKKSNKLYSACVVNRWLDDVCKHMLSRSEAVSLSQTKWTLEKCKKEALKYKTRIDFNTKSGGAYAACKLNKWIDIVCKHMLSRKEAQSVAKTKWTLDECKKEALKYKTRSEFGFKSSSAYGACKRNKWVDIACSHMPAHANQQRHEEKTAQPQVLSFLKKMGLKVEKEFSLSSNSRVDFLCTNKLNRKINIEVKSDKMKHSDNDIKTQISRYKIAGKKKFGNSYAGTFLVSPKGRYGYSLPELKSVLKQKGLI